MIQPGSLSVRVARDKLAQSSPPRTPQPPAATRALAPERARASSSTTIGQPRFKRPAARGVVSRIRRILSTGWRGR